MCILKILSIVEGIRTHFLKHSPTHIMWEQLRTR